MIFLQSTISISTAAIFGGVLIFIKAVLLIYFRRTLNAKDEAERKQNDRISSLERKSEDQRVKNQQMEDFQEYKNEKDNEFSKSVKMILANIDSLKTSIHEDITELKVKIAEITK